MIPQDIKVVFKHSIFGFQVLKVIDLIMSPWRNLVTARGLVSYLRKIRPRNIQHLLWFVSKYCLLLQYLLQSRWFLFPPAISEPFELVVTACWHTCASSNLLKEYN